MTMTVATSTNTYAQPDSNSNPNPNPNHNPTTKRHAIVNIPLNTVTCPTYPEQFKRDNVVAPFVPTNSIVIVTLPQQAVRVCFDVVYSLTCETYCQSKPTCLTT